MPDCDLTRNDQNTEMNNTIPDIEEHIPENGKIPREPKPLHHKHAEYNPHLQTVPYDSTHLCPIHYRYDYLPQRPHWLVPQPLSFRHVLAGSKEYGPACSIAAQSENSILLHIRPAGLPAHTGLPSFRQSKHWKSIVRVTEELLELFAADQSCQEIMLSRGSKPTIKHSSDIEIHELNREPMKEDDVGSMASLARRELETGVLDSYCRFSIYLWPEADEERAMLIAQTVVLTFMFDDVWETLSGQDIPHLRDSLISRLLGTCSPFSPSSSSSPPTPLQARLDSIRTSLLSYGNAGAEVLDALLAFLRHESPPVEGLRSVRSYLDFRWEDIGMRYTYALTAFSIASPLSIIHILSPSPSPSPSPLHPLLPLLHHLGDIICIINDLASYDKERTAFESGKSSQMINVVDTIMRCGGIDAVAAKGMAFAWQLFYEAEMGGELEMLTREGGGEGAKLEGGLGERELLDIEMQMVGEERQTENAHHLPIKTGMGQEAGRNIPPRALPLSAEERALAEACLVTAAGSLVASVVMARYGGEGWRV